MNESGYFYTRLLARIAFALGVSFLFSCNRSKTEFFILPPPTYPLSRAAVGYGVIVPSYVNLSNAPEESGISQGYLRRGGIVAVLERRLVNKGAAGSTSTAESWVFVAGGYQGWLHEEEIDIYMYEEQAKTASEKMSQ